MTQCMMAGCNGELDKEHPITIKTGCFSYSQAFGCATCGRVHSGDGSLMSSRRGDAVYLNDEGRYYNAEGLELLVYSFTTENYRKRRVRLKAQIVAAIKSEEELQCVDGKWLLCWNPRTDRWVPEDEVSAQF